MQNSGNSQQSLLGELESIIDLLDSAEPDHTTPSNDEVFDLDAHSNSVASIPVLDDVVNNSMANSAPSLLDLDSIFSDEDYSSEQQTIDNDLHSALLSNSGATGSEEEQSELFPLLEDLLPSSKLTPQPQQRKSNYQADLQLLIQELVDEMIPELEARLRQQLSQLAPEAIHELAEKHLNK
ncbi:hypothetical protein NO559_10920 [Dasania sp. GY-MA-18]|uniref:Uncharacterized protein n=1 Tax=Dasania phycosphaerae TaxID=2950436 RepID=A0A9J6RNG2_9GAMM|nr:MULTISPECIES: hypothetical protein [Dasania]MCR8923288.1 hypothetical protein [Dasania sp. GY-MA-18]MCZ0865720.1 hypothetical protein [Dasania phycosphaerae]MCZ0869445.1 hypothetical protein [Dasania phycosphaerae]